MLYPNQLPGSRLGERTVMVVHHHWYTFVRALFGFLGLLLMPFAFGWALLQTFPWLSNHPVMSPLLLLSLNIYCIAIWMFFSNYFIEWYLDTWIVTSERLLDIRQLGLFNRTVSELHLDRIQDITITERGIAATTANFGSITVTTAEAKEHFEFSDMPNPEAVRDRIYGLMRAHQEHADHKNE